MLPQYLLDPNGRVLSFEEEEPVYSVVLHQYRLVEIINRDPPVQIETMKGAIGTLRVRPVITDSQNRIQSLQTDINNLNNLVRGLNHEIHSLSTSRKRMIKQFIKRTLHF